MKYFFLGIILSSLTTTIDAKIFEIGDTRVKLGDLEIMVEKNESEEDTSKVHLVAHAKTKYGKEFHSKANYIALVSDLSWSYTGLYPYMLERKVYITNSNQSYSSIQGVKTPIKLGEIDEDGTLILDEQYHYESYLDFDVQTIKDKFLLNSVGIILGVPPNNWKNKYSMVVKITSKDLGFTIGFYESFFFYGRCFSLSS